MKLRIVGAALALVAIGLYGAGMIEAESCRSSTVLGCVFAGLELIVAGMFVGGGAALVFGIDAFRRWRASREKPMPKTLAEIEAEIRSIEVELARLSRTGS